MFTSWFCCDRRRFHITATKVSLFVAERRSAAFQKEEVALAHRHALLCSSLAVRLHSSLSCESNRKAAVTAQNRALLLEPELCARFNILIDHFNAQGFFTTHPDENQTAFLSRFLFYICTSVRLRLQCVDEQSTFFPPLILAHGAV